MFIIVIHSQHSHKKRAEHLQMTLHRSANSSTLVSNCLFYTFTIAGHCGCSIFVFVFYYFDANSRIIVPSFTEQYKCCKVLLTLMNAQLPALDALFSLRYCQEMNC